jgi:hypothetical protein
MDTSIFAVDVPAWLSWSSHALVLGDACIGLLVIILVSCLIGQRVPNAGREDHKRTPLAH